MHSKRLDDESQAVGAGSVFFIYHFCQKGASKGLHAWKQELREQPCLEGCQEAQSPCCTLVAFGPDVVQLSSALIKQTKAYHMEGVRKSAGPSMGLTFFLTATALGKEPGRADFISP